MRGMLSTMSRLTSEASSSAALRRCAAVGTRPEPTPTERASDGGSPTVDVGDRLGLGPVGVSAHDLHKKPLVLISLFDMVT